MESKLYTPDEFRKAILALKSFQGNRLIGLRIEDMLCQAAEFMERNEKRFIIRSNDDGSFWVSPHRWLKGHCAKATIFSSAFYAKKAVEFENKSKSGRGQLPQVYEIMEDGRLRLVSEEECAK